MEKIYRKYTPLGVILFIAGILSFTAQSVTENLLRKTSIYGLQLVYRFFGAVFALVGPIGFLLGLVLLLVGIFHKDNFQRKFFWESVGIAAIYTFVALIIVSLINLAIRSALGPSLTTYYITQLIFPFFVVPMAVVAAELI